MRIDRIFRIPRPARPVLIIFALALVLRVVFFILESSYYNSPAILHLFEDSKTYMSIARYMLGTNIAGAGDLLLAGPGYGLFLAAVFFVFGVIAWPVLIIQIILGSLTCVYLYKIALYLLDNKTIALIAGILAAVSLSAISLASSIMSDTLFFFLLTLATMLWVRGHKNERWREFLAAGILIGLAVLVRSVGAFLPVVLIAGSLLLSFGSPRPRRKTLLIRTVITSVLIIFITVFWGLRNYAVHDLFTVSETGALAAKRYLCARVIYEAENRPSLLEVRNEMSRPTTRYSLDKSAKAMHDDAIETVITTFKKYPGRFMSVFVKNIYENIGMESTIHPLQVPQLRPLFRAVSNVTTYGGRNHLPFLLALIGAIILVWRHRWQVSLFLALVYIYFALLSGFTFWQGSRIFFPGQLAWVILAAVPLEAVFRLIRKPSRTPAGTIDHK